MNEIDETELDVKQGRDPIYPHKEITVTRPVCMTCDEDITAENPGHEVYARLLTASQYVGDRHYKCDSF